VKPVFSCIIFGLGQVFLGFWLKFLARARPIHLSDRVFFRRVGSGSSGWVAHDQVSSSTSSALLLVLVIGFISDTQQFSMYCVLYGPEKKLTNSNLASSHHHNSKSGT